MTPLERFRAVTGFRPFDRLPLLEWAPWWDQTVARWHGEGLPRSVAGRYDLCRHFGLEVYKQHWFRACGPGCPRAAGHGQPILRSMEEYERLRPHLFPDPHADAEALRQWEAWARERERGEIVVWITLEGFFWFPRTLLGIEEHLYAFFDQPELLHRINRDLAEWQLRVLGAFCGSCPLDFLTFAEDMSYNHGPMLSELLFEEFLRPYYDLVVPEVRRRGILPLVDTDGEVSALAPWLERAGLAGILPLERQAGVDIDRLRAAHPRMVFLGHFDKMTMNRGEAAMRSEFERLLPVAAGGGFLVSCDHQTPPGVAYVDYRRYLGLFREYAEEAGRRSRAGPALSGGVPGGGPRGPG